jgi:hypothetical protein
MLIVRDNENDIVSVTTRDTSLIKLKLIISLILGKITMSSKNIAISINKIKITLLIILMF